MKNFPTRYIAGFALPSAVFLMVILALLAAFIVQVATRQQVAHAADVRGSRAALAAQAGVEWGVYRLLRDNSCAASNSFNAGGSLAEFTITVACQPAGTAGANDEGGTAVLVRRVVATACSQPAGGICPNPAPGSNYVEREFASVVLR